MPLPMSPGSVWRIGTPSVEAHAETVSPAEAPPPYERPRDGKIYGRAVVLPNG
ncbi:hypothetical protein [Streptomyces brevispora]|uniref:Uncharacterized protein n=1 Tax=Streptomyces brevispora TaxID=887462 RepID=A0ABZ1GBU5_9ACTN|nr:hypothetical protein [Streptomyces brevispora]WSC17395.1 hypothetical protein OIE64_34330 [Streptomyces brevispora]